jgi:hypothetical protein
MISIYILLGGITLFVGIITAMDEWTRRQDRSQARNPLTNDPHRPRETSRE